MLGSNEDCHSPRISEEIIDLNVHLSRLQSLYTAAFIILKQISCVHITQMMQQNFALKIKALLDRILVDLYMSFDDL